MRRLGYGVLMACLIGIVASTLALLPRRGHASGLGLKGKLEVRVLELGYVPESKTLKLRAQPAASGAPITELTTADPETVDRLLRLADMKVHGARLAVELDGNEIKAIDVATGGFLLAATE